MHPPRLRLHQISLGAPVDQAERLDHGGPAGLRRLRGTLSVRSPTVTHLVGVGDVVELLVALMSDLPYAGHGQYVQVSRTDDSLVQVFLLVRGRLALRTTLPPQQFIDDIREMVDRATAELTRCGAGALAGPMLAVLSLTSPAADP